MLGGDDFACLGIFQGNSDDPREDNCEFIGSYYENDSVFIKFGQENVIIIYEKKHIVAKLSSGIILKYYLDECNSDVNGARPTQDNVKYLRTAKECVCEINKKLSDYLDGLQLHDVARNFCKEILVDSQTNDTYFDLHIKDTSIIEEMKATIRDVAECVGVEFEKNEFSKLFE